MTQVVQASCPHCRNPLRIPADWLGQPMRCKFCRNIFEANPRAGDTPLPANAISAAPKARAAAATEVTATPPAAASLVFATDTSDAGSAPQLRRRGGGGNKLLMLAGCGLLVVIVGPAVLVTLVVLGVIGGGMGFMAVNSDGTHEVAQGARGERQHGGKEFVIIAQDGTGKEGKSKGKEKALPGKDKKGPGKEKFGAMPRRALLINVCNYLYLNRVDQGRDKSTSLSALKNHGISNAPLNIPPSQIFMLSDEGETPHPTELSVVKNAIKDYCDTCRAQDRVIILFAGHATENDKDCFLIPIGGKKEDPDSMLPLAWVYDQLSGCKARQKVLILDVFRFPPARGFELPGAGASEDGEMGEVFDKMLQSPPPGVQVWSSCIKGQRSIEFEGGSVFLQALSRVRDGAAMTGIDVGTNPLAINDAFAAKINTKMKELIGPGPLVQTSRLAGKPPDNGAPYDVAEQQALPITLKAPVVPGGDLASYAEVNSILADIKRLPAVRKGRAGEEDRLLKAVNLPPFPAKVLVKYKPDDNRTLPALLDQFGKKDPQGTARMEYAKKYPVRAAVVEAIEALNKTEHLAMRETLNGPINDKQKAAFLNEQKEPGKLIFELESVMNDLETLAGDEGEMGKETSKRWRAHFDFTRARLKSRFVYIYEYNYLLGQIRLDALPNLEPGQDGWRVASRKKIQASDAKAKQAAKDVAKAWQRIQKEYRDTPWAVLAYREGLVSLGLEWKAKKE